MACMASKPNLTSKLAKAYQQLESAQSRIAELEAQLVAITPKQADTAKRVDRDPLALKHPTDLQPTAARFEAILNNCPDAILLISADLTIQQTNVQFNRLFRVDEDAYLGISLLTFIHPDSVSRVRDLPQVAADREHKIEVCAIRKDGTAFDAELNVGIASDNGLVCTIRDITERKRIETALQKSTAEIHDLYNNAPCGYHSIDKNGVVVQINDTELQWLGYSREEVVNKLRVTELFTPKSLKGFQNIFPDFMVRGWVKDLEFDVLRKDGSSLRVLLNGTAVYGEDGQYLHSRTTTFDVTELRKAQKAVIENEERYRLLAENIADVIMTFTLDRRITYMSPSCERLLGYLPIEVEGKFHSNFIHPDDYAQVLDRTRQAVASRENFYTNQFRLRHQAGHYIWYEVRTRIVYDPNTGNVVQFISVLRDIADRKHLDDALRESEDRFRRAVIDAPFPIMLHADDGEILHISNAWSRISGYTHAEIPTMNDWVEKAYRETSSTIKPVIAKVYSLTEARRGGEFHIWTKSGEERIWDFISAPLTLTSDGRKVVSSMAMDITERKRTEEALKIKMEEEHQFQSYLKALHKIIIELTGIDEPDTFYKRVVELGRERLGLERLAMFLYDEHDGSAIGTFGVDTQGNLTDERGVRFMPDPNGIMRRSFEGAERFYINEQATLFNAEIPVGIGWNAAATLWKGTQTLGWLVADNLLSHTPATKALLEVIGLYALSVGTLLAQKQTQLALRDSDALHRLLAENVNDLIMRTKITSECIYVSPSVQTLLGYTTEELIGQHTFDLVHPDDQAIVSDAYDGALERKTLVAPHQYRARHKAGHYIWLETVGKPLGANGDNEIQEIVTSSRDITERKQTDDALRESEAKYRSLIETMRGGLATFDTAVRVTYVNDRFCELLGYAREEVLGKQLTYFVDAAYMPLVQSQLKRRQSDESASYEIPIRHKNGQLIYMLLSGSPLLDKQGNYAGSIVVATDITIQKQAEEALRQALAKEKDLGDLKTRFVSMASHEFRTPLATILALVETLSAYRKKLSEEQIDQRFDKIKDQVGHLKDIMEDVLMLARMQARRVEFNPVKVDLDALTRSALDEFQNRSDIHHKLEYTASAGSHEVVIDRKLMRQAINNLVSNAIKYSPEDKVVRIDLSYTASAFILKIRDEGIGIPEADLPHLFEPFHRATNVGTISGTGLGLVITKEAVDLHRGTITVESQLGVGTSFIVRIPLSGAGEKNHEQNSSH